MNTRGADMGGIVLDGMGEKEYLWLEKGLKKMGFFSKLSLKQLSGVLPYMALVRFEEGAVVCAEGDPGDGFYLIYEGEVEVTKRGWDKPVATLRSGAALRSSSWMPPLWTRG